MKTDFNLMLDKDLFFEIWDMFNKEQIKTRKEYTQLEQEAFFNSITEPKYKHIISFTYNQDE